MSEIYNGIEALKQTIDNFVPFLITNDRAGAGNNLATLTTSMSEVLPQVIALYDEKYMAAYAEDRGYWLSQLERVLDALEKGDFFLAYDALVHELKANLTELQRIISMNEVVG